MASVLNAAMPAIEDEIRREASGTRPKLPLAAITADLQRERKTEQACGLMQDAIREAIRVAFGAYATGPEERQLSREIEKSMQRYFAAKRDATEAVAYMNPEGMARLIDSITVADPTTAAETELDKAHGSVVDHSRPI